MVGIWDKNMVGFEKEVKKLLGIISLPWQLFWVEISQQYKNMKEWMNVW